MSLLKRFGQILPNFQKRNVDNKYLQEKIDLHNLFLLCSLHETKRRGAKPDGDLLDKWTTSCQNCSIEDIRDRVQNLVLKQIREICSVLDEISVSQVKEESSSGMQNASLANYSAKLLERQGFSLEIRNSSIKHASAGDGVWLMGRADVGKVIAMVPGEFYVQERHKYIPGYPSLGKDADYMILRFDGTIIDPRRWMKLCRNELDEFASTIFSGIQMSNPLSYGHMINHPGRGNEVNIVSAPFMIKESELSDLRRFIPLVHGKVPDQKSDEKSELLGVAMVALRPLENEELFLNYRLNPNCLQGLPEWYCPIDEEEDSRRWTIS
eukprot:jgi/Picsp_1/4819/NSC_02187-R2_protein